MSNPRRANSHKRNQLAKRVKALCEPCWICLLPIDHTINHLDPEAFTLDELRPVSKGGSPYDPVNAKAAHRCCNNWRKNRSVAYVERIRSLVTRRWATPEEFVSLAKRAAAKARSGTVQPEAPRTTTKW